MICRHLVCSGWCLLQDWITDHCIQKYAHPAHYLRSMRVYCDAVQVDRPSTVRRLWLVSNWQRATAIISGYGQASQKKITHELKLGRDPDSWTVLRVDEPNCVISWGPL